MKDIKNTVLDAYKFRYACKAFDPSKKITGDDFNYIMETGRLSPSSFGWEPWKFVVVQNAELREKLKEFAWGAQKQLSTASHFVLLLGRKSSGTKAGSEYLQYMASDIQNLPKDIQKMKLDFYGNFQQKDFDLTDNRKLFDWASKQVYIAMGNMMTAAAMIGVDSCPMEGFDKEKTEAILVDEGIINPDEFGLSTMVAFGYRAQDSEIFPKTRRHANEVIEWIK